MNIKVESFQLDHRMVKAPYVRKAGQLTGPKGDIITKYDIRLIQPNTDAIPTGGMHTLEHLFATYFRDYMDGIIDISPMGCRTGFYLIKFGDTPVEEVKGVLKKVLKKVLETKEEDVPATNEIQCGNYRDHSLFTAREYAKYVLDKLE
ncbi:S-ribosylhomocysteine lyase /quorum-sensing autoinducer 2 (AI-2) synthesis protein LuxS [Caldanaerobius fijiensis DSM 17918]|uniref:S-ribosylhomocysteine lyase n=1 Tax=Caldanaerobius fijiensis DSM 17918 TaxID=1121256 RepID=A0A1M4W2F7_9THEO|nr:S-ribosylhomocysteine lyase [Caldanaerobius fijiensis]SHE75418.1 S-ribosylhomocysteine lyase /quorum-sensing autoinducer 2 (AI-2) synthesis protein LuxS [Caldanaerobius fijiensis DSM 17918]